MICKRKKFINFSTAIYEDQKDYMHGGITTTPNIPIKLTPLKRNKVSKRPTKIETENRYTESTDQAWNTHKLTSYTLDKTD